MHIVFLGARLPLTKTFVQHAGAVTASPYPHVSRVTSYHAQANSLQGFKALLEQHAAHNHCLFNGHLTTPLRDESRAGKTQPQPREWVVFDFDKIAVSSRDPASRAATDEVVSQYLPAECQHVSYIVQLSASMFRPDNDRWSGHIFMLLKPPVEAVRLKQWFEALNFTVPKLTKQIRLSDSLQALHWPLDRTVAYDSKLIYIAQPKCLGFEPTLKQHITLVKKRQPHLSIPNFLPIDQHTIRLKINELRRAAGESEIDYDITQFEGNEILRKTDVCLAHDIKTSGDHYIRFNVNGGDSYAYYIDLRAPDLIRNFKGEPYLVTKDALPDLYKSLCAAAKKAVAKPPLDDGSEVLAFYATNQSSSIKVGCYSPTVRKLNLNNATETAARAWLAEYGLVQKGFLAHMDLVFDPTSDVQYIAGIPKINTFRATDYMTRAKTSIQPSTLAEIPPVIGKTLRSMLGDPNNAILAHFINWLAYIFQIRQKTGTGWVLHGRTGTGKSSFVRYILTPIFGADSVKTLQFGSVGSQFNAFLENTLFVVFEESDTNAVSNQAELMSKLRHWITDSPIEINQKGVKTYQAANYSNFFFNANAKTPVVITGDDRRFNLPERQDKQLFYSPNELRILFNGSELDVFADVLQRWPIDAIAVTRIVETEAKRDVHEATTSINQLIAEAIIAGDLQFFIDRTPSDAEAQADFFNRFNPIGAYKTQLDTYIQAALNDETLVLKDEQLFFLFRVLIPDTRYFQDSKTWRRRHYKALGLDVDKRNRAPGSWDKFVRGVLVRWQRPEGVTAPDVTGKVTRITKPTKPPPNHNS